jgi:hypothetical protein
VVPFTSTATPSASRTQRLTRWLLTVVLAGTLGTAPLAAPASAGPIDQIYQPRCEYNLCLTLGETRPHNDNGANLTAWSLYDVGPTPYFILIYEVESGELYRACGSGTDCYQGIGTLGCRHFIAYIGRWSATMPPLDVIRTSPVVRHPGGSCVPT